MGPVVRLIDYCYGEVETDLGRNGNGDVIVRQRVLVSRADKEAHPLPRKRRIGKMGPARVLEFRRG
jgi:hypothetical protein